MAPADMEVIRQTIHTSTIPIVSLESAKDATTDGRFNLLSALAARLGTRKVIFLSPTSGLEREGSPHISDVNLSVDYDRLLGARGQLARRHYTLLRQVRDLLNEVPQRASVAVVSPLALLRELFTVSGAGTMIRKGSRIESHSNFDQIDRERLRALLESAFGKLLKGEALERGVERIYVEENYLGAALLSPSPDRALPVEVRGRADRPGRRHRRRSVEGHHPRLRQRVLAGAPRQPHHPLVRQAVRRPAPLRRLARVLEGPGARSGGGGHRLRPQRCRRTSFRARARRCLRVTFRGATSTRGSGPRTSGRVPRW